MKKYKIELNTMSDINKFVNNMLKYKDKKIKLTDGTDYTVNAKSLLGAVCSMEWDEVYCLVPDDLNIYNDIAEFIV